MHFATSMREQSIHKVPAKAPVEIQSLCLLVHIHIHRTKDVTKSYVVLQHVPVTVAILYRGYLYRECG